jgi:hypothetical protein
MKNLSFSKLKKIVLSFSSKEPIAYNTEKVSFTGVKFSVL